MTKLIQIVPVPDCRLFGEMVKKEIDLGKRNRGTFYRSGAKARDKAKWSHTKYKGWVRLQRSEGEVVAIEVQSRSQGEDMWQLLHAFIGWVDRHFGDKIQSVNIQYRP